MQLVTANENDIHPSLMAISVMEPHHILDPVLSPLNIYSRLEPLWREIRRNSETRPFSLNTDSVLRVNQKVIQALGMEAGIFRAKEDWESFCSELGKTNFTDDSPHISSWIFSKLYWDHLTDCRLSTAWFFVNVIRIQHKLPEYRLSLKQLGHFLEGLSDSGPPTNDGQTFYLDDYSTGF